MKCSICITNYIDSKNKLTCDYCGFEACRKCITKYILNTSNEPSCMSCKKVWDFSTLYEKFTTGFLDKLRKRDIQLLIQKEQSLILESKSYIDYHKYIEELKVKIIVYKEAVQEIKNEIHDIVKSNSQLIKCIECDAEYVSYIAKVCYNCHTKLCLFCRDKVCCDHTCNDIKRDTLERFVNLKNKREEKICELCNMQTLINEWSKNYTINYDVLKQLDNKTSFICKCPIVDCRGIIYNNYKCNACHNKLCEHCYEILNDIKVHVCNLSNIETIQTLKRTTKPCPKCATLIQKIDGCNQMWCTHCNNAFDWISGNVSYGPVHNPHYFEWCKAIGHDDVINMENPIYQGMPDKRYFMTHVDLVLKRIDSHAYNKVVLMYKMISECYDLLSIDEVLIDIIKNNLDLRLKWIFGNIDEKEWGKKLFFRYKQGQTKKTYNDVLRTFTVTASYILHLISKLIQPVSLKLEILKIEKLIDFTNECFKKLCKVLKVGMPKIVLNENKYVIKKKYKYQ